MAHPNCPSCVTKIGILNRTRRCALCGKDICSTCIQHGRFCEECAEKVPEHYRTCNSSLDWVFVICWLLIGFSMMGMAWWLFSGWQLSSISDNIKALIVPIVCVAIGLLMVITAPFVPKLGTRRFYHKMKHDTYRNKILDEIQGGVSRPKSRSKTTLKLKLVYVVGLLINLLVFWAFLLQNSGALILVDTNLANATGSLFVISVVWNFLTLFLAATFYSNKSRENRTSRVIIEFLSWSYALILPFAFLEFVAGTLIQFRYIPVLSTALGISLVEGSQGIFRLSTILIFILQGFLLFKTPNLDWKANNERTREKTPSLFRWLIVAFFVALVFIAFLLSVLVLITDVLYIFNVTGYILNFVYLFFIFGAIKLIKSHSERRGRIRISKETIAKFAAVILIINIVPTIGTTLGTNPALDRQFASVFGGDWNTKIVASGIPIKLLPYSCWDAFFGYPQIPSNGYFGISYGTDSPRYVINPISGAVISNGTAKYLSVVHDFKFDLYLPAGESNAFFPVNLTPGDGHPKQYPLVLMIHGLGADRGTMNANITSQIFANNGYAVCDISFGDFGWYNSSELDSPLKKGYDLPDTIFQIAKGLQFLESNANYYHVNVSNTAVVGRSWGGLLALISAYAYTHPFYAGNFSSNLHINSVVAFYPTSKILTVGDELFELGGVLSDILSDLLMGFINKDTPAIRGSDDPDSSNYNAQWKYFDPFFLSGGQSGLTKIPNTLLFQGTHDFGVPPGWTRDLENHLRSNDRTVIAGYYPLAAHAFDAVAWSHFGQSTMYYMSRFIFLSGK